MYLMTLNCLKMVKMVTVMFYMYFNHNKKKLHLHTYTQRCDSLLETTMSYHWDSSGIFHLMKSPTQSLYNQVQTTSSYKIS